MLKLPIITLSILLYNVTAIIGTKSTNICGKCRVISLSEILQISISLFRNGHTDKLLKSKLPAIISEYIHTSCFSLTKRKIHATLISFIIIFLVTVSLNLSIPKKNQLISTTEASTAKNKASAVCKCSCLHTIAK